MAVFSKSTSSELDMYDAVGRRVGQTLTTQRCVVSGCLSSRGGPSLSTTVKVGATTCELQPADHLMLSLRCQHNGMRGFSCLLLLEAAAAVPQYDQ